MNTAYAAAVRKSALPLVLVVSLFFLWGVANNLNDILIRQFKKAFELTDLESGLVQSAFIGYFLFAIPAGLVMRRYGYKAGIVVGLVLYGVGAFLFYPAADLRTYGFFLFALFVIASGLSFLETSANPFVTGSARRKGRSGGSISPRPSIPWGRSPALSSGASSYFRAPTTRRRRLLQCRRRRVRPTTPRKPAWCRGHTSR